MRQDFQQWLRRHPRKAGALLVLLLAAVWWLFALPRPLFKEPLSLVAEDENGQLLGAILAEDEQWRFPASDSIPQRFADCVVAFEDKRFWRHPGVDVRALMRALRDNIRSREVRSGASTINMQVIRLARHNPPRTLGQKALEILLALRLEAGYSKAEVIRLWADNAPFGGNVVGLQAAAWRYFGKAPHQLSWGEAAALAVLPNSPALVHPGKNRDLLQAKRNRVLATLLREQRIDNTTYQTAIREPLPAEPLPLPDLAPHLLQRLLKEQGAGRYRLTLDAGLQLRLSEMAQLYYNQLAANGIHNLAVLVVENETGKVLAYLGNTPKLNTTHSPYSDMVVAYRSPGSLLKPLLYAQALQRGQLLPGSLLPDVPTSISGFRPDNFHENYTGAIPADEALARSLNIPFVNLLQDVGVPIFHDALLHWGFKGITKAPGHYGLSLILGGCEVSLWEAVGWYSSMARMLKEYPSRQGMYQPADWHSPRYLSNELRTPQQDGLQHKPGYVGAGAAWATVEALQTLLRPDEEGQWTHFSSSRQLAWKTGTSYGFRDAWAVGVDARYTIGVWVGNADGEGRPGLIGARAAAPLLFQVARALPTSSKWFEPPWDDLRQAAVCRESGYLAKTGCPVDSVWVPKNSLNAPGCAYHQLVYTDPSGQWRMHRSCSGGMEIAPHYYMVLPATQAHYYKKWKSGYAAIPPWHPNCAPSNEDRAVMQWIYPTSSGKIKPPRGWEGKRNPFIFQIAHSVPEQTVHWHLDSQYLGSTKNEHKMPLLPQPGNHLITVEDEKGRSLSLQFEVVE